jgi:hypothetical protein
MICQELDQYIRIIKYKSKQKKDSNCPLCYFFSREEDNNRSDYYKDDEDQDA